MKHQTKSINSMAISRFQNIMQTQFHGISKIAEVPKTYLEVPILIDFRYARVFLFHSSFKKKN